MDFVNVSPTTLNPPMPVYFVLSTPNGYVVKQGKDLGIESIPGTTQIYVADFNGDGRADIFFPGYTDGPVLPVPSVMAYQQPNGSFLLQPTAEKIASHNGDFVDVNGDGRPDMRCRARCLPAGDADLNCTYGAFQTSGSVIAVGGQ